MLLTPDFYRYDWQPLESVEVDRHLVVVRWADGAELVAFDLWLRENAVGGGGVDPATREGILDPARLGDAIAVDRAEVTGEGALRIVWRPDLVETSYHPGWLRHVADGEHLARSWLPEPTVWTTDSLPAPPTHDGPGALADDEALRAWVNDLIAYGVARLSGLGSDPAIGPHLAIRIGPIRDTNFGPTWDVKADVELAGVAGTNSTANTTLRLGPHTDLPTRETPPGFQFLHCVANTVAGGWSTMADGAAVVEHIAARHAEHYQALTTLRWIFSSRGPGIDHRWSAPLIDLGAGGQPPTLRAFYPVRGFPDMAVEDMPRAYAALRCFYRVAAEPRFQITYPFAPGDLVGFDNRRILHGRDAFTSDGHRHLRGLYIDHDDVYSYARVANRRAAAGGTAGSCQPDREVSRAHP